MKLSIPDMNCGHCKASVERAVAGVDASAVVGVDLATRTAEVTTKAETGAILVALKAVGFEATAA